MFSTMFDVGGILGSPLLGLLLDQLCQDQPIKGVTATLLAGQCQDKPNKGITAVLLAG